MRRTVLSLVAARAVSSKAELATFFQNTFYWHQILENNPKLLDAIVAKANKAIDWLLENRFVEESHSTIQATPLGKSTSLSGLLPETAKQFRPAHDYSNDARNSEYSVALLLG
jgi:helicase